MVETFFKTLKAELVWRTIFQSRIEAAIAIGRYIEGFYNVSSEHTSRYVVDAKRLCWATSCSAGCFEDLEDSSASLRAVGVNAGARLHRFPEQRCINDADEKALEHGLVSWASSW